MILTCKCLNITIEVNEFEVQLVDSLCLSLSPEENPQTLFNEGARQVEIKKTIAQVNSLVQTRMLKNKTVISRCVNCCLDCYSLSDDKRTAFVNRALISDLEMVNKLKNDKKFSPAFRIIVAPVPGINPAVKMYKYPNSERLESAVTSLQKQLGDIVQDQIAKTEERIKTFSEQEYVHLKEFRDRAHRDHQCLLEAIYAAQRLSSNEQIFNDVGTTVKPSIEIPIATETGAKGPVKQIVKTMQHHQRRREKNCSFDSEGLFAIEGMEDWASDDQCRSEGESDTDHDDSGSHDEGIDIHRRQEAFVQLAKSLPVNVPVGMNVNADLPKDEEPLDAVDIAASIKALARSLHGDAVFGDLPRPRFSTQI